MPKIITEEQIKSLEEALVQLNIPVQAFIRIQDMFKKLPEQETK